MKFWSGRHRKGEGVATVKQARKLAVHSRPLPRAFLLLCHQALLKSLLPIDNLHPRLLDSEENIHIVHCQLKILTTVAVEWTMINIEVAHTI